MRVSLLALVGILMVMACTPVDAFKVIPGLVGLHYDVEPHSLSEWDEDWESVASDWVSLAQSLHAITHPAGLTLRWDLNVDQDGGYGAPNTQCEDCLLTVGGLRKLVSEHILDASDGACMMLYHSTAENRFARGSGEAMYAKRLKRSNFDLGVALNLKTDSKYTSDTLADDIIAAGGSLAPLEDAIDDAFEMYAAVGTPLQSAAIHTYGYWRSFDPPSLGAGSAMRDIYLWCSGGAYSCNIYDDDARAEWLSFASAHRVRRIYLDAPAIVRLEPPSWDQDLLVQFCAEAHALGMEVELIFGKASWALADEHEIAKGPLVNARAAVAMVEEYGVENGLESWGAPPLPFSDKPLKPNKVKVKSLQSTSLNLKWNAKGKGAMPSKGFQVKYRQQTESGGEWGEWEKVSIKKVDGDNKDIMNLMPNTDTQLRVRAKNHIGTSKWSKKAKVTTPAA
eukprot:TRINITY_DN7480_c0_g1_i1.p1 TRINITY_DN7480_c0_g1~~TRINITY_DN7480_c0_g1_i1.p1  ORF type:complete len:451 (+),score=100.61 TRINITY_DN7480_c0_g1_i1:168-1520(+)